MHVIPFIDGSWDGQRDHVYLVRTAAFDPPPALTWEQLRAERVHELRWWTLDELAAAAARRRDVRAAAAARRWSPRWSPTARPATPLDVGV